MPGTGSQNNITLYCSADDITAMISAQGVVGRLDDDDDDTLSSDELQFETTAQTYGSERVNFYCLQRFAAEDLAKSWLVNYWATVMACHWLSCRRGNPPPGSFDQLAKDAIEDMKQVHSGLYTVPGIGEREVGWPAWSNVRVDVLYPYRKIRVERGLSERTGVKYPQPKDIPGEFIPFDL